jgi:hypothetical protein
VTLPSSNERWTSWSAWDAKQDQACGTDEAMTGIQSHHSNHKEDRRFKLKCTKISGAVIHSSPWAPWANNYDGELKFKCEEGLVVTGMQSTHDNHFEDRRFKFRCGEATSATYSPTVRPNRRRRDAHHPHRHVPHRHNPHGHYTNDHDFCMAHCEPWCQEC